MNWGGASPPLASLSGTRSGSFADVWSQAELGTEKKIGRPWFAGATHRYLAATHARAMEGAVDCFLPPRGV
jgi:hypothetical protein